jgi:predicted CxxxxCH...CXXCH cytochrome family protein
MRTHHILSAFLAILLISVAVGLTSCSDLNKDLPVSFSGTQNVHDEGWKSPSSPNFHGEALKKTQYDLDDCASCHSKQYTGGVSGVSCFKCHSAYPHPAGYKTVNGHPTLLYSQNYPLAQCKSCHGATYNGDGDATLTCMKSGCHVDATNTPKSPEACSTCHGTFTAPTSNFLAAAPPKSVLGDTATTVRGVGAHQKHLVAGTLGKTVRCRECHTVPSQLNAAGHLGPLPAEVAFNDTLAGLTTAKGTFTTVPSYNPSTLKCSSTFCHGSWKLRKATSASQFVYTDTAMVGEKFAPAWTGGSAEATCGSCHGLPPKGHLVVPIAACGTCHDGIVSSEGRIADRTRHVNGKINVFGQEYAF